MAANESPAPTSSLSSRWTFALFVLVLAAHFGFATHNFEWGFLIGHEFRQAQTALISEYIDKQNNFGIYYETPVLGKPWAFPLEYPFYQWVVVLVKRTLDLKLFEAARGVSLASFYLALPAFWLLLGSFGVSAARRWVLLAVTLFCPALIFYSRSFLIDPMAMSFSAWFLAAFVRMMDTRKFTWLGVVLVTGTLGALIKSLVFAVWLFPAALYGAWCLWRSWRAHGLGREVGATIAWGLTAAVVPLGALKWWIGFTDAIKEAHRSGYIFTSKNLSVGNFGTFTLGSRFEPETWRELFARWSESIASPAVVIGTLALGLVFCRRRRDQGLILLAAGVWMFGQLAFPYAYAFQDYYFYAGVAFLTFAFGFVVVGVWEHGRGPLVVRALVALVPCVGMARAYTKTYFPMQQVQSNGGSGLAEALRDQLPAESVIMVLGHDWDASLAYYSKHRALMVRNGLDADYDYLDGAIGDLADDDLAAVVISGRARENPFTRDFLIERLGLIETPAFRHRDADVYLPPRHYERVRAALAVSSYNDVVLTEKYDSVAEQHLRTYRLSPGASRVAFPMVTPGVRQYRIKFGYNGYPVDGARAVSLHPEGDLWLNVPGGSHGTVELSFGLTDPSWNRDVSHADKTDGVEFALWAERNGNEADRRLVWSRFLDPRANPADRGQQHTSQTFALAEDEHLVLSTRPGPTLSFDWAYLTECRVTLQN